jgi:hypothetical protein
VLNIEVQKGHNHPTGDIDHVGRPKAILEHAAYLLELGKVGIQRSGKDRPGKG